jgi:hypothetical protein
MRRRQRRRRRGRLRCRRVGATRRRFISWARRIRAGRAATVVSLMGHHLRIISGCPNKAPPNHERGAVSLNWLGSVPTPSSQAGQNHGLGCQVMPLYIHDQSFQRRALGGRSSEETRRARAFYYCYYKADAGTNTACAAVRCLGLWVTRSQVLDPEYVCSVLQTVRLLSGCLVRRVKILVVSHQMFR